MVKPLVLTVDATVDPLTRALRAGKATLADFGASADTMLRKMNDDFQNGFQANGVAMTAALGKTMQTQFREMQRNAEAAIAMGKNWDPMGGTSSTTSAKAATGYQQAADAANLRVEAIQRVLSAEQAAASVDQGRILQLKTMLVATKELALGMEEQAAITRSQAVAFAAVEAEMGASAKAGSDVVASAHNRMGVSSQIMMHSVRAASDSFAAGAPPMMIFTEQISRLAEASVYYAQETNKTTGIVAKFGQVMGGAWGLPITLGISLLGTLIGHMDLFSDKVGEAAEKLKDQAAAAHVADQAQAIFDATLDGAIAKERKLTEELDRQLRTRRQIIDLQVAGAQQSEIELRSKVADARKAYEDAQKSRNDAAQQPANGEAGRVTRDAAVGEADIKVKAARDTYFDALTSWQNAQTDAIKSRGIKIAEEAKDQATPQTARQAGIEKRRQSLTYQHDVTGTLSDDEYRSQMNSLATEEASNKKTPRKGRVDHTAEREAEAEKKSDAAYDEAYAKAESDMANIARQNVTDLQELATLDKAAIDAARVKQRRATEEQGRREQWSAADILALQLKQDEVAEAQKRAVDDKTLRESFDRSLDYQKSLLSFNDQMLSIQGQLAPTQKERLRVALEMLENERQSAVLDVRKDVNDGKKTADEGDAAITGINQKFAGQKQVVQRQNASPMDSYKQQLTQSTGDMNTALQNVEVTGLKGLEDGLTGLISGTESVSQAFTKMATSILADLARIAIEKAIVSVLGLSLSTGGKVSGGFAKGGLPGFRIGGLPGYAGGSRSSSGMISGPGTGTSDSILALVNGSKPVAVSNGEGIVNEKAVQNYWPIIDSMNKGTFPKFADGGLVSGAAMPSLAYPSIPSAGSVRQPGMTYAPYIDVRGAVVTQDLLDQANQMAQYHATRAGSAALTAAPDLSVQKMTRINNNRIPM